MLQLAVGCNQELQVLSILVSFRSSRLTLYILRHSKLVYCSYSCRSGRGCMMHIYRYGMPAQVNLEDRLLSFQGQSRIDTAEVLVSGHKRSRRRNPGIVLRAVGTACLLSDMKSQPPGIRNLWWSCQKAVTSKPLIGLRYMRFHKDSIGGRMVTN